MIFDSVRYGHISNQNFTANSAPGMKEHAYFFGSCSVLVLGVRNIFCSRSVIVPEKQQNFCSCSVLVIEQEHVREQVLEQIDPIFL